VIFEVFLSKGSFVECVNIEEDEFGLKVRETAIVECWSDKMLLSLAFGELG
jgi:hypothetical protein